jgi:Tfp pilus assembly protein PilO
MFRYIIPTILIIIAITGFVIFANPIFNDISTIKTEIASYNEALDNSKALESERDKLTQKYNAIDPSDLDKLQKLLPDNVDNIRLILEIEKLAAPYGMILEDVKYNATQIDTKNPTVGVITPPSQPTGTLTQDNNKQYGIWNLEFSTEGTYPNFINFTKDLESNLRIVDISSVAFASDAVPLGKQKPTDSYKYDFKIKTYWLKN